MKCPPGMTYGRTFLSGGQIIFQSVQPAEVIDLTRLVQCQHVQLVAMSTLWCPNDMRIRIAQGKWKLLNWKLRGASYQANALNEYTSRTVPGAVDILGLAWASNSVLLNGQLAERKGEYFRIKLSVNNSNGPVWQAVAVTNSGGNAVSGHLLVPGHLEGFPYDAAGNLTIDSLWTNTWNAENWRLVVESSADVWHLTNYA